MNIKKKRVRPAALRDKLADSPNASKEVYEEISAPAVGGGGGTLSPSTNGRRDFSQSRRKRTKLGSKVESKAEVLELRSYRITVLGSPHRPRR